jgi:hypothetical protein
MPSSPQSMVVCGRNASFSIYIVRFIVVTQGFLAAGEVRAGPQLTLHNECSVTKYILCNLAHTSLLWNYSHDKLFLQS